MSAQADAPEIDAEGEEVREVFARYGRAVYAASCVETGLAIALMHVEFMAQSHGRARRERKAPSRAEWQAMFDAYLARQHGLTLGTLIDRFRSVWRVEPALDDLLQAALDRRNFLIHGYFRERAVDFAHSAGRAAMIEELDAAHDLLSRADEAVQAAVAPILPKLGIDPEHHAAEIEEIGRQAVAKAQAEANGGG